MKQHRCWYLGRADGPSSAADNAEHCPYLQKARWRNLVARLLFIIVVLAPVRLWAGKNEPPKPIVTPAELAAAAAEVPVMRLDFTLPEEKTPFSSNILADHFFNRSELSRFHGLTTTDWRVKWDTFGQALAQKAAIEKLDSDSLKCCLASLTYGRNQQTRIRAFYVPPVTAIDKPQKEIDAEQKAGEAQAAEEDKKLQLIPQYNESIAIVPIGAYRAKYSKGDCWIITCAWEYSPEDNTQQRMGHIMVWALDAKTCAVVAYSSCD